MSKINWSIWLRMPSLTANQAVALSLGIDPSNQAGNRPAINGDRLTLFKACHKTPIAPADLAKWAQSVEWNIPIELAALSQIVPVELVPLPTDAVIQALSEIVAPGVSPETFLAEVLKAGVKFTSDNGESIAVIPDGTLMGHRVGFKHLRGSLPHSVAHLIRGSGASGGGAAQSVGTKPQQSAPATDTAPEQESATPAPVVTASDGPAPKNKSETTLIFEAKVIELMGKFWNQRTPGTEPTKGDLSKLVYQEILRTGTRGKRKTTQGMVIDAAKPWKLPLVLPMFVRDSQFNEKRHPFKGDR